MIETAAELHLDSQRARLSKHRGVERSGRRAALDHVEERRTASHCVRPAAGVEHRAVSTRKRGELGRNTEAPPPIHHVFLGCPVLKSLQIAPKAKADGRMSFMHDDAAAGTRESDCRGQACRPGAGNVNDLSRHVQIRHSDTTALLSGCSSASISAPARPSRGSGSSSRAPRARGCGSGTRSPGRRSTGARSRARCAPIRRATRAPCR